LAQALLTLDLIAPYNHGEDCFGPRSLAVERVNNSGSYDVTHVGTYVGTCDNNGDRTGFIGLLEFR